jgi:acetolactate synthase-1/2/3 large subunit
LGAKCAAPDRDIIADSGDGFYMFGTPAPALWAAAHYRLPFMIIVYQNRSYTTGTLRLNSAYPDPFAKRPDFDYEGSYFDPPIDFAKEAEAAGAYGENVRDPDAIGAALKRGREQIRRGVSSGHLGLAAADPRARLIITGPTPKMTVFHLKKS